MLSYHSGELPPGHATHAQMKAADLFCKLLNQHGTLRWLNFLARPYHRSMSTFSNPAVAPGRLADLMGSSAQACPLQFSPSTLQQQLSQQLLSHAGRLPRPSCRSGLAKRMAGPHRVDRAVLRGQLALLCAQKGSHGKQPASTLPLTFGMPSALAWNPR